MRGKCVGPLRAGATNRTKILTGSWGAGSEGGRAVIGGEASLATSNTVLYLGVGGFRLGVELTIRAGVAAKLSGSWRNGVKADGPLFGLGFYWGSGKD